MRVFVTGGTGFVGSAVVRELKAAGHQVLGLARSDAGVAALREAGVEPRQGDLADLDTLQAGARDADGVIHLAFNHDFSAHAAAIEADRRAIEAMIAALEGTGKPFVCTSGTAMGGRPVASATPLHTLLETDRVSASQAASPRAAAEAVVLDGAARGVRSSVMRLPPSVHGPGDHGFIPALIGVARQTGVSAYVDAGTNVWPSVHRLDAARLYRLALEQAVPGSVLHAVADEGVPFRSIAEAIAAGTGTQIRSLNADEAAAHFTWMVRFVTIDNPTSSAISRETYGWTPAEVDLLTDLRTGSYFA